jgi:tetratricopeptide (TPR) repeat protein/thiol-disulfide isomerase/thioredoxin
VSQSPLKETLEPWQSYLDSWRLLAERIRQGNSFSGREPNCLFLNTGGPRFADASSCAGFDLDDDSRGLAVADWDHDGDLDIWLSNRTGPRVRFLRNDFIGAGKSVAFLLEGDPGRGVSRDAIGTRVELEISAGGKASKQIRTVTAGNGFVSQSTRWLVFGLGEGVVESINVRWPAGAPQVLKGADPGGRYRIVFGQNKLVPMRARTTEPSLQPGPVNVPELSDAGRVWLKNPLPVPQLKFTGAGGEESSLSKGMHRSAGKPLLVNLWAPWCQPCLAELKDFTENSSVLQSELSMLALNVEEPSGDSRELIETTIGFPFAHGSCDKAFVDAADQLTGQFIYRHRGIPVPFSMLIGPDDNLYAIYKGSVSATQLTADAKLVAAEASKRRDAAVPFAGQWSGDKFITNPVAVAQVYLEDDRYKGARSYLLDKLAEEKAAPGATQLKQKRIADLLFHLGRVDEAEGTLTDAIARYREAVGQNAAHLAVRTALASALSRHGVHTEALAIIEKVADAMPEHPEIGTRHGEILDRAGKPADARKRFEELVAAHPRFPLARQKLVTLLATSPEPSVRDPKKAQELSNELRKYAPGNPKVIETIAIATEAAGDKPMAIKMLKSALELANRDSDADLVARFQAKLDQWGTQN